MKGQISCPGKPKLRRATTMECKVKLRGSWLQKQKEKHDESQPRSLMRKQTHSSGGTNYFLALFPSTRLKEKFIVGILT